MDISCFHSVMFIDFKFLVSDLRLQSLLLDAAIVGWLRLMVGRRGVAWGGVGGGRGAVRGLRGRI